MINPEFLTVITASVGVCFGGWAAYLTAEKARIISRLNDIETKAATALEKADLLAASVSGKFQTREEHREFDNRISKAIDRLSDRIDQVLGQMLKNAERQNQ